MSPRWIGVPRLCLIFLAIAICPLLAIAKSDPEAKTTANEKDNLPSTATLPKSYPVITAKGPCPASNAKPKAAAKAECKVIVTREEFEALVNGMNPHMVKGERQVLANAYGKALALAMEATRRGLDQDPRLQAQLRYSRLIMLANATSKELYNDALASPEEDAEKYYAVHKHLFERFTFDRIYVPLEKRSAVALDPQGTTTSTEASGDNLHEKDMKELAEQVYSRALAGESFDKLQKEVFKTAEISTEPNTKVEDLRRGDLSEVQNVIFDLEPGKISPLLVDQTGYFIYKLVSRTVPPFDSVKQQVTVRMQNDKSAEGIKRIEKLSKAEVNGTYFEKYDPPPPDPNEPETDQD
jgi:hypothetical protein